MALGKACTNATGAEIALGRAFADGFFTGGALPSAALGKGFAEGKVAFAECIRHSAKWLNPVVDIIIPTKS